MNALAFPWLLSYLFNALWQIPLIFAAAWVVTRMLRSASPRRRAPRLGRRASVSDRAARLHSPHRRPLVCAAQHSADESRRESRRRSRTLRSYHRQRQHGAHTAGPRSRYCSCLGMLPALLCRPPRLGSSPDAHTSRAAQRASRSPAKPRFAGHNTAIDSESALRHRRLQPRHMELAR